jgi:uncharacterized protein with HEPN domain
VSSPSSEPERIRDILDATVEIRAFLAGMDREQFLADRRTLKAVVADLSIIGEAARYVPDAVVQAHPEIPWLLMTGMRNRIVHGYYQVDPVIVWDTCQQDLPSLAAALSKLLEAYPETDPDRET